MHIGKHHYTAHIHPRDTLLRASTPHHNSTLLPNSMLLHNSLPLPNNTHLNGPTPRPSSTLLMAGIPANQAWALSEPRLTRPTDTPHRRHPGSRVASQTWRAGARIGCYDSADLDS